MALENTHIHNSCTSVTGSYLDTGCVGIKQQMVLYTFIPLSGIVTLWLCSVLVLSSNHRLGLYLKVFFLKNGDQFTKIINHQSFFITEMFLTLLGKTETTNEDRKQRGDKIRGCCFSCCLPHSFQCVFSFLCLVLWSFKTRPKRRLEELTVKTRAWAKKWVCVYPLCKSSCKVTDFQSHGQQMEVLQMILCCHWASTASLTSRTSDKTRKTKWRHIEN